MDAIDAARNDHGDGLNSDGHADSDAKHRDFSPDDGNARIAGDDVADGDHTSSRREDDAHWATRPAEFV